MFLKPSRTSYFTLCEEEWSEQLASEFISDDKKSTFIIINLNEPDENIIINFLNYLKKDIIAKFWETRTIEEKSKYAIDLVGKVQFLVFFFFFCKILKTKKKQDVILADVQHDTIENLAMMDMFLLFFFYQIFDSFLNLSKIQKVLNPYCIHCVGSFCS